jgi:hypothetical protein
MTNRNGNSNKKHPTIAPRLPKADSEIASYPRPFNSIEWAGKMVKAVSSSGTPRKVAGIMFRKVWDMDVAIIIVDKRIKARSPKGDNKEIDMLEKESIMKATLFTCNPGINPVKQPKAAPRMAKEMTRNRSIIFVFY